MKTRSHAGEDSRLAHFDPAVDSRPMTLVVYQLGGRPWGMPNFSPFCTKLETYLRMTRISHEIRDADLRKAPKGKVPYVDIDGKLIGDTRLIIDYLNRKHTNALDSHLTPEQHAIGHA